MPTPWDRLITETIFEDGPVVDEETGLVPETTQIEFVLVAQNESDAELVANYLDEHDKNLTTVEGITEYLQMPDTVVGGTEFRVACLNKHEHEAVIPNKFVEASVFPLIGMRNEHDIPVKVYLSMPPNLWGIC
jgi:hypothetical protein